MSRYLSELPGRLGYLGVATALILSQHLLAWTVVAPSHPEILEDPVQFWLMPLQSVLESGNLSAVRAAVFAAFSLGVALAVAFFSFRRAQGSSLGNAPAVLSIIPILQVPAILALGLAPSRRVIAEELEEVPSSGVQTRGVVFGLIAGVAIIVLAVLVSAVTFGSYGWGLFVMTPLLVGLTTGYLVNQEDDLGPGKTNWLVIGAAGLGSLALVIFALEGIVCIVLAAPLAIPVTVLGGVIGRAVALSRLRRRNPLASIAVLPLIFMLEAAMPPEVPIATSREVDIAASPDRVWAALTSPEPIQVPPGLTAWAGLAYPISGQLDGQRPGALRTGKFSTGLATEEVTHWEPGRTLAFRVLGQPPAMEEMSPYRRVHAPHLIGYFDTNETRFDLTPLADGRTRLRIRAQHVLRIDPVAYWEPIARLAIRDNVDRVLQDIADRAER